MSRRVQSTEKVTDASPDYSHLPSLMHSITASWPTPEKKCWALFYWNQGTGEYAKTHFSCGPAPRASWLAFSSDN